MKCSEQCPHCWYDGDDYRCDHNGNTETYIGEVCMEIEVRQKDDAGEANPATQEAVR